MDINMPGVDGIGASQAISRALPGVQTIIMSVQSESDYLRRAMLAGARDFLMKPFSGDEVAAAIRRVYESRPAVTPVQAPAGTTQAPGQAGRAEIPLARGHVITVFSPKGGSGCTTVALNLAAALQREGHKTILVDGSLQFGDVAFMLNLRPKTSMVDLAERVDEIDADLVSSVTLEHASGVEVLLAPPRPEMAEYVSVDYLQVLLKHLRTSFDFIVIDTASSLSDTLLAIMDVSDRIVVVLQQSLPSIKNARLFLDLTHDLDYQPAKVKLVINRAVKRGVSVERVASTLKRPIVATIPEDEATVERSISDGTPIVVGRDARRPIGSSLRELAMLLADDLKSGVEGKAEEEEDEDRGSRLSRLFGR
jgi:pilus assembly protein CpaE